MNDCNSWGRTTHAAHTTVSLTWADAMAPALAHAVAPVLPFGLGRSYGDSCLNADGTLLLTESLDHLLAFDPHTGVLRCEAGASFAALLDFCVPHGWFLPVTPGTQFVTVGGAIANDVHGKNHHRAGTFGCHVRAFELLRSDGTCIQCSPTESPEWFCATIGGLGLTGVITWAEIQLKPIVSPHIDVETIRFNHLNEFFALAETADRDFEYTVAWVDSLARGAQLGRGHFMRGNHATTPALGKISTHPPQRGLRVPFNAPDFLLNRWSIRAFNSAYFHRQRVRVQKKSVHYAPFFYPLDVVQDWNRLYGRRGFFQYQCVVPLHATAALTEIFERVAQSGQGSFLSVLKKFGDIASPGLLSFPQPGYTLAMDFGNGGDATRALLRTLDAVVLQAGGRLYPAKDATMSAAMFQAGYPQWREFARFVDPKFSSSFWRRVTT